MSDLLIKGLELPKNYPYRLTLYPNGHVKDHTGYSGHGHYQAIELPPHGRLIDADKLLPESGYDPMMFKPKYGGDHRTQYNTLMGYEILYMVDEAPTVLEASE